MHDNKTAQMIAAYICAVKSPSPRANAAMMKLNEVCVRKVA